MDASNQPNLPSPEQTVPTTIPTDQSDTNTKKSSWIMTGGIIIFCLLLLPFISSLLLTPLLRGINFLTKNQEMNVLFDFFIAFSLTLLFSAIVISAAVYKYSRKLSHVAVALIILIIITFVPMLIKKSIFTNSIFQFSNQLSSLKNNPDNVIHLTYISSEFNINPDSNSDSAKYSFSAIFEAQTNADGEFLLKTSVLGQNDQDLGGIITPMQNPEEKISLNLKPNQPQRFTLTSHGQFTDYNANDPNQGNIKVLFYGYKQDTLKDPITKKSVELKIPIKDLASPDGTVIIADVQDQDTLEYVLGPYQFDIPPNSDIPTPDSTQDWKTYQDEQSKFLVKYPVEWTITKTDVSEEVKLVRILPLDSINSQYCTKQIDCYPEVWIELSTKDKPNYYLDVYQSSPCQIFGECLLMAKNQPMTLGQIQLSLGYLNTNSDYPSLTYADLPDKVLLIKGYAPSSKNCQGNCPVYQDSQLVTKTAKQIEQIISTLELIK